MGKVYHHPDQITVWDILGMAPVEMKAPARPTVLPVSTPEPAEPPLPPLTAEDLAAIEHLAKSLAAVTSAAFSSHHDDRWEAFALQGAVPAVVVVPAWPGARSGVDEAVVRITRTRLGYTSGHHIHTRTYGSGGGGFHRPDADAEGWFLWTTRQAAIQAGAAELWQDCKDEALADHVRNHFAVRGVDVMQMPGEEWKRRLVSRAEVRRLVEVGPSAEDRALDGLDPTSDALAYEREVGLTDVDYVPHVKAPDAPGVERALMARFEGVIDPPSELTLKRRKLKREREEAAAAARTSERIPEEA